MRPIILLATLLPLSALAAEISDVGTDLPNDPYHADRALTQGRLEGFRELYVDPDAFADALAPAKAPTLQGVDSVGPLPESGEPVTVRIELDADALSEAGVKAGAVAEAVEAAGLGTVTAEGDVLLVAGVADPRPLWTVTVAGKDAPIRATSLGRVLLPEPTAPETVPDDAPATTDAPEITWVPAVVEPAELAAPAERGALPVHNTRSSWGEISVNGEKLGIIGPYDKATIHDVAAGTYELTFRLANGFTYTKSASTR